jgi:hypothetical protein
MYNTFSEVHKKQQVFLKNKLQKFSTMEEPPIYNGLAKRALLFCKR